MSALSERKQINRLFALFASKYPRYELVINNDVANRTIGTCAVGGMLIRTLTGVLVVPRLDYLFGRIADNRYLLKDEADEPLSEVFEHASEPSEARDRDRDHV